MGVLEGIKRRLLGQSRSSRAAQLSASEAAEVPSSAPSASAAGGTTLPPPATSASPRPAQWTAPQHGSGHLNPVSPVEPPPVLELANPRRIRLGQMPAELAALERQFAELPQHQAPSKAVVSAQLRGAGKQGPRQAAALAKPASRGSPRKGAKALRRPLARAASVRRQPSTAVAAAAAVGELVPETQGSSTSVSALSKLAQLRQRQARRSRDGLSPIPPGSVGAEASWRMSAGSTEAELSSGSWTPSTTRTETGEAEVVATTVPQQAAGAPVEAVQSAREQQQAQQQLTVSMLTPRVIAAAAERSQPRTSLGAAAGGSDRGQRTSGGAVPGSVAVYNRASSASSNGAGADLSLTLSPWAAVTAAADQPGAPTHLGNVLPAVPATKQQQRVAAARTEPFVVPVDLALTVGAAGGGHSPLRQRLPHADLPSDLLSLRESATLVRLGGLAAGGRPPLPQRRAKSDQEPADAHAAGHAGPSAGVALAAAHARGRADAAEAGASVGMPGEHTAGGASADELSEAGARLAALRQRRRPGWNSDIVGAVPNWQYSQDGEALTAGVSGATASPAWQCAGAPAGASPAQPRPGLANYLRVAGPAPAPSGVPAPAPAGALRGIPLPHDVRDQQPVPPRKQLVPPRQQPQTRAELRQHELWGSLAGMGLEEMLRRPAKAQQTAVHDTEPADRENSMAGSNNSSPKGAQLQAAHKLAVPPHADEQQQVVQVLAAQSGWAGSRQGRRRTTCHQPFMESLERVAALHRAQSDSEQHEGGTTRQMQPALRQPWFPIQHQEQRQPAAEHLPPLHPAAGAGLQSQQLEGSGGGTLAAQPHGLPRVRSGGSFLAHSCRRGSSKEPEASLPQPAAESQGPGMEQQAAEGTILTARPALQTQMQQAVTPQQQQQQTQQAEPGLPPQQRGSASGGHLSVTLGSQSSVLLMPQQAQQMMPPQDAQQQQWSQWQPAPSQQQVHVQPAGSQAYTLAGYPGYGTQAWQAGQVPAPSTAAAGPGAVPPQASQPASHQHSMRPVPMTQQAQTWQGAGMWQQPQQVAYGQQQQQQQQMQASYAQQPLTAQQAAWVQQQQQQAAFTAARQAAWLQRQQVEGQQWAQQQQRPQQVQAQMPGESVAASGRRKWQAPAGAQQLPQPAQQTQAVGAAQRLGAAYAQAWAQGIPEQHQSHAAAVAAWQQQQQQQQQQYYRAAYGAYPLSAYAHQQQQQLNAAGSHHLPQLGHQSRVQR